MRKFKFVILAAFMAAMVGSSLVVPSAAHAATSTAAGVLSQLRVAADVTSGYDRALFPHWVDANSNGCDTRKEVLIAESVTTPVMGSGCTVVSGTWLSYFDGATWSNPSDVDIDHLVPLAEAWRSGANAWTNAQRQAFANDLDFPATLAAVTDSVNQSKSDRDPANWLPSVTSVRCQYATEWTLVKYRWNLSIDTAEQSALASLLSGTCGATTVTLPTVAGPAATTPVTGAAAPVYRFWSDTYKGHFYTISRGERDQIIMNYPVSVWKYEGVDYGAFTTQQPGTVPLYRFWSTAYSGHFYTTSLAERNNIIATSPVDVWKSEGIAYYVYPKSSAVTPTKPVARFWSDTYRHHFYTADATEASNIRASTPAHIWRYETNDFRVPTAKPAAALPIPVPVPTPPAGPAPVGNPGNVKNCSDFVNYAAAYAWFMTYYPLYGDVAQLDGNGDGVPCESLPGAPR